MRILFFSFLAPLLLGCHVVDDGYGQTGNPNDHQLVLKIYGPSTMYAGATGATVTAERSIESSQPINWFLVGLGTISNTPGTTSPPNQGGGQYYLPPATLVTGSGVATIYYTTIDPVNNKSQTSPSLSIQLLPVTTPMSFVVDPAIPADQTIVAGNDARFTVAATPIPAGFSGNSSVQWTIKSVTPQVPSPGGLMNTTVTPEWYSSRTFHAPVNPPSDYDVVISATMHDPWFNIDPVVTMMVHVKKN